MRIERSGPVVLMERHDGAYRAWKDAGVSGRTLVHMDAHHDLWWAETPADISIANFIAPALAEGLVREVLWVVPDATWRTRRGRRAVVRHMRRLGRQYPGRATIHIQPQRVATTLLGRPVVACPLASLVLPADTILLDIDVDYLVIPEISPGGRRDRHSALPWCWPDELLARLAASGLRTDLTTIASSVDGGYTPLRWKYLGDELRARLASPGGDHTGWALMRQGALAEQSGDVAGATRALERAAEALPLSAGPWFARALLEASLGRAAEAETSYRRAVALDPTYRTPYVTDAFRALWDGDLAAAEAGFRATLTLDPQDPWATLGLAGIAGERRQWPSAMDLAARVVPDDATAVDAHRVLGRALAGAGRTEEAIAAYERSLKLTLTGLAPVDRPIASDPAVGVQDPEHCVVHARLADLYRSRGEFARAAQGYRIALAGGQGGVGLRLRLAWCCVRAGDWSGLFRALASAG